jgi:vacuolar-type H+-ATPase subunit I/STV1
MRKTDKTIENLTSNRVKKIGLEEPSADFTGIVMNRVRLEAIKSSAIYQPLISRQMWLKIYIGLALFILGAVLLRSWFPGNETPALVQSFYRIDFSILLKPFLLLSNALNKLTLPFIGGILAVSLLLLSDQLYAKFIAR